MWIALHFGHFFQPVLRPIAQLNIGSVLRLRVGYSQKNSENKNLPNHLQSGRNPGLIRLRKLFAIELERRYVGKKFIDFSQCHVA